MKRSSRFSVALHVLAHLSQRSEPQTSEDLAACVSANPVVIRRTMAGLREVGIVTSERGHGGGWRLAKPAASITLRDVYVALGESMLQGARSESAGCLIEQAVSGALDDFFRDAEAMLVDRLSQISLEALNTDVADRLIQNPHLRGFHVR